MCAGEESMSFMPNARDKAGNGLFNVAGGGAPQNFQYPVHKQPGVICVGQQCVGYATAPPNCLPNTQWPAGYTQTPPAYMSTPPSMYGNGGPQYYQGASASAGPPMSPYDLRNPYNAYGKFRGPSSSLY